MGIEPTAQAWEAWVLPLYDARASWILFGQVTSAQIGAHYCRGEALILANPAKPARLEVNQAIQRNQTLDAAARQAAGALRLVGSPRDAAGL
jgi:hypothetical protein